MCPGPHQKQGWGWRRETGLSPPVKYFTDRSKPVLLLWIFYVFLSYVCYGFVRVCLFVPCGHLLGKSWPLGSHLWCITVSLSLSNRYPGSGVVLDCIDSWSLHPYLLLPLNSFHARIQKVLSGAPKFLTSCFNYYFSPQLIVQRGEVGPYQYS